MLTDAEIKRQLLELYPSGTVHAVSIIDQTLHINIRKNAKLREKEYSQYIQELGFKYSSKRKNKRVLSTEDKLNTLAKSLLEIYPNGEIMNLSSANLKLYSKLNNTLKELNITREDFYEKYNLSYYTGKEKQKDTKKKVSVKYDYTTIKELIKVFNISQLQLAKALNISRQFINLSIKKKYNKNLSSWIVNSMSNENLLVFEDLIKHCLNEIIIDEKKFFYIGSNLNYETPLFCFFYVEIKQNEVICECLKNIPHNLSNLLKRNCYHIFKPNDLKKINSLVELNKSKKTIHELTTGEANLLNGLVRKNKIEFPNVQVFLDRFSMTNLVLKDTRALSNEKIRSLLANYYIPELDIVKIPTDNKAKYHRIRNLARNRKLSLEEFIESFGYKYERTVTIDYDKQREKYKEILKPYILPDGKIYISSSSPIYYKFYAIAQKSGTRLSPYLKSEFGYERYENKSELPKHFIPFDWRNYRPNLQKEKDFQEYINDHFVISESDNTIYIPTNVWFYFQLTKYGDSINKSINELLKVWGYKRLFKRDAMEYIQNTKIDKFINYDIDDEEELNKNIIDTLSTLQTSLDKEKIEGTKLTRSKRMVNLLKELYNYECQLCGEHSRLPIIEMKNGYNYVEVHHIVPLSNFDSFNDESRKLLDHYSNAVVVCPQHHKIVHFHQGGYNQLINKDNKLFFVNKNGVLPIHKNLHLDAFKYPKL
ncbi:hypothetical protein M3603_11770 [Rummeliibacillus stabekisii]|uniref:HNH endonuclease n=1 Tax=Rummeliibacillus stabekisii TaxID=241244 RepID=UPI0020426CC7|nr:HNH endonuclease [Rummeliibacillus stabekisii]MCM3317323.1 hypothetical protein [Rummeliibacillus stabekisii]